MAEKPKPKAEILYTSTSRVPDEKGEMHTYTHIVYRDERGVIGTVTLPKEKPTDAEIADAIRRQREKIEARKTRVISL